MDTIIFRIWILFISLCAFFCSCSKKNYASRPEYDFKSIDGKPHYDDLHYWAAHPWKHDVSDSVPAPLRSLLVKDSIADIFFIYPTTFLDKNDPRWNAGIDDSVLNASTDYSTILRQATVFNEDARVFAPRYRQAHYRTFTTKDAGKKSAALAFAYEDVKTAFEYYLAHYNNGRPIIIAAHSQGTLHAIQLLKDFFDGKPLQNRLVAAYIIGMPVPQEYFSSIPECKDSLATGCIISWRSYLKGYAGEPYIALETKKSIVINPLSWTSDPAYFSSAYNHGSVLLNFNKVSRGVSAQVHNNILWTGKPKFFGNIFLTMKNYHIADINMFYVNIREDVKRRISIFLK